MQTKGRPLKSVKEDHMSPDKILRKKILNYFKLHTEIDSSRTFVEVKNGIVTLSGRVDGPIARASLEGYALTINGVSEVINKIELDNDNMTGVQGIHL